MDDEDENFDITYQEEIDERHLRPIRTGLPVFQEKQGIPDGT
jgi:hypothetical protein